MSLYSEVVIDCADLIVMVERDDATFEKWMMEVDARRNDWPRCETARLTSGELVQDHTQHAASTRDP